jgi:hypothetical protein
MSGALFSLLDSGCLRWTDLELKIVALPPFSLSQVRQEPGQDSI